MKRILALMLAMGLTISLAACAGKGDESGQSASQPEGSQSQAESSQSGAVSEEIVDPGPLPIDTSWASNEFEMMIPKLPFHGWTVTEESENMYALRVGGLSDHPALNTIYTTQHHNTDRARLVIYLNSLPDYGLTVEEIGKGYKWLVTNPEGHTVEFTCAEGFCWATFRK